VKLLYTVGVFIDLKKAFDMCSHGILLKKLDKLGIKNIPLNWFGSYLSGHKQKVEVNGMLSDSRNINISVFSFLRTYLVLMLYKLHFCCI
jgi:hypothetical protein